MVELAIGKPLFHPNTKTDNERMWLMQATLGPFDNSFINLLKAFNPKNTLFTNSGTVNTCMSPPSGGHKRRTTKKPRTAQQLDNNLIVETPERFLNILTLEVTTPLACQSTITYTFVRHDWARRTGSF